MFERLFKVLYTDGTAYHGGTLQWSLPNRKPGKWHRVRGPLVPCENGLHLCRTQDLLNWLGPAIFLAEARMERIDDDDKLVVRKARLVARIETWTERSARLFAVACARRALERERAAGHNPDGASHALDVATMYADGQATKETLAAAWAVVGDAAKAAARDAWVSGGAAARAAAWAVVGDAAKAATWAAAWAVLGDAAKAGDAAWAAARAAERQWQTRELMRVLFPGEDIA
jgi:hypothetical protein